MSNEKLNRSDVENDVYDITEWFNPSIELPSFEEAAKTNTGMGMMQAARIGSYKAAKEIEALKGQVSFLIEVIKVCRGNIHAPLDDEALSEWSMNLLGVLNQQGDSNGK